MTTAKIIVEHLLEAVVDHRQVGDDHIKRGKRADLIKQSIARLGNTKASFKGDAAWAIGDTAYVPYGIPSRQVDTYKNHELVHVGQYLKSGRYPSYGAFNGDSLQAALHKKGVDHKTAKKAAYLANPIELMAHANEVAWWYVGSYGRSALAVLAKSEKGGFGPHIEPYLRALDLISKKYRNRFLRYVADYMQLWQKRST